MHTPRTASSHNLLPPSQSHIAWQTTVYSIAFTPTFTSYPMNTVSPPVTYPSQTTPLRLTIIQYSSNLAWSWPPSASPNSHDPKLQHSPQTALSTTTKFTWWRSPHASQTRSITTPRYNSTHVQSQPASSHDRGLHVHLRTCMIMSSQFGRSLHPSSHGHGLQVRTIKASKLSCSGPQSASPSSVHHNAVNWWSSKADSPSWTPHRTSHSIRKQYLNKFCCILRRVGTGWEDMNGYPAMMNHTNCVDISKLGKGVWDQQLWKIEFGFRIMRWCLSNLGSAKYILPVDESVSIIPVSPYVHILRDLDKFCHGMMQQILWLYHRRLW